MPILEFVGFARPEYWHGTPILAHLLHGGFCESHRTLRARHASQARLLREELILCVDAAVAFNAASSTAARLTSSSLAIDLKAGSSLKTSFAAALIAEAFNTGLSASPLNALHATYYRRICTSIADFWRVAYCEVESIGCVL